MSNDANGLKTLTMDADGLRKIMAENVKVAQQLQNKFVAFASTAKTLESINNAFNQLSSTLSSLTGESIEFGKAMREANTMAGEDAEGFKKLRGQVADLAKEIPIARDKLANGLYQVISNGVPKDNWMDFLNASARSAVGGLADINQVVGVTSTLIKNYGLEWSAAADIQDKIQLTAKNGVTSFEQLAAALPRVTGNAATLGVSIDELMGTFATLTGVSGNTAEVSTQLAAIFTALVKPSSEAAKMAEAMGIQFNAAAIKAAGGFRNFLTQLDADVKSYAQSAGVLEQEVYAKLFGSAESLRALISLQGELADKFATNVSNMVNSAGTMSAAYNEMSSTGEAAAQKLQNEWAVVADTIARFTAPIQPIINFASELLNSASSVAMLAMAFKQLSIIKTVKDSVKAFNKATLTLNSSTKGLIKVLGTARLFVYQFGVALTQGTKGLRLFAMAWKSTLISTGIGIAIVAVTTLLTNLIVKTDEATDSTNKLRDAEERAKQNAEALEQARRQETSVLTETRAALDLNIRKLKEFNGTKEEEKKLVNEMNNTYGETMEYFSSVADWYNALISNSEAYCRQMVIEARARNIANQIFQKEQEIHDTLYDSNGKRRMYTYTSGTYAQSYYNSDGKLEVHIQTPTNATAKSWPDFEKEMSQGLWHQDKTDPTIYWRQVSEGKPTPLKVANDLVAENRAFVANLNKQLTGLVKEASSISFRVKGSTTRPDDGNKKNGGVDKGTDKNKSAAPVGSLADIDNRISALNAKIKYEVDPKSRAELYKEVQDLEYSKHTIEFKYKHPDAPGKLSDLADIKPKIVPELDASKITPTIKDISDNKPIYRADANNLVLIQENIQSLQDKLQTASIEEAALLNKDIEFWQKKADAIRNAGMTTKDAFAAFSNGWGNIKNVGSGIDSITGALSNNGNAWQKVTGIVDGFLQVFDGIKSIVSLINTLVGVTQLQADAETTKAAAATAATAAQGAEAATADATAAAQVPVIAANKAATASFMELASAAYFAAHASIPFAGFGIASGFVSASAAMVKAAAASVLTPFANGGIVSGPTVGLIGEYAGASSNPEVVAPLDKLRKLINPVGQPVIIGGTLRAAGRELVCVLANETRIAGKSGRRTNIKI